MAFHLKVGPKHHWERALSPSFQPANWWNKAGSVEVRKEQLGGGSSSCPSEPLEGPLERISCPGALRLEIQLNRQVAFPSEPRNFQRDPGSLNLSYKANGCKGCVHVTVPFLLRLELLPSNPGSGITAL